MSRIVMLKPADGIEGVKKVILDTVDAAGPTPVRRWWLALASAEILKNAR